MAPQISVWFSRGCSGNVLNEAEDYLERKKRETRGSVGSSPKSKIGLKAECLLFQPLHCFLHCPFVHPQSMLATLDEEDLGSALHFLVKTLSVAHIDHLILGAVDD